MPICPLTAAAITLPAYGWSLKTAAWSKRRRTRGRISCAKCWPWTAEQRNFGGKHGNCHLAVGSSYADTFAGDVRKLDKKAKERLGFNDSSLHWDLINTEQKTVHALLKGGKTVLIYEKGRFTH